MMGMGSVDMRELVKFQENLNRLAGSEDTRNSFCESCAKELAARLLTKVIKRTPVGKYPASSGKVGGTLRRGWTAGNKEGVQAAVDSIQVTKSGNQYTIKIMNPTEYASFVEFGHRTANHNGWVKGQFMMTISENEIKRMAPGLLEKRLEEFLGGTFND
jgi:hypothetical protein|nr:MAG TPA: type I neck protein [Caudoviricetes sp.]DAZ77867.1 MAG TPA: type I neck protein [Caudoviricetes sp.]